MKNIFAITIGILSLILVLQLPVKAQEPIIPDAILANFNHLYPGASDVYWEKENLEYTASYAHKDFSLRATFIDNEEGEWKQTVTSLDYGDLPDKAQQYLDTKYKGKIEKYDSFSKVEVPDFTHYFANFDTATNMVSLTFDTSGRLLNTEIDDL